MGKLGQWFLNRLREASTWRGFVLLATSGGVVFTPAQADALITFGLGLAGLLGAFMPDRKG